MMHAIVPNIEPATAPPQLAASADIVEAVLSISFGRLTNQIAIIKDSPALFFCYPLPIWLQNIKEMKRTNQ